MAAKSGQPFFDLKSWNWQNILVLVLMVFYLTNFGFRVVSYRFPYYAQDFLAFWSAGKIADTSGFSHIYDFDALRTVETNEMIKLGLIENREDPRFLTMPSPYLAIYIVPFQFLSRINIQTSSTIWLIINFLVLTGYLYLFYQKLRLQKTPGSGRYSVLLLMLFSYPVFDNFLEGQLNVFLMICAGEFIRNAMNKKLFISGIWLAGLFLKPQLLIFVVPVVFFLRNWKTFLGFLASSGLILVSSWILSGSQGMKALFFLITGFTHEVAIISPQYMINWRMPGVNINVWTHSYYGWIVTGIGMLMTLNGVIILLRKKPAFGSDGWLKLMVGVFSATLAFTWHAHIHMAIVMIPLLLAGIAYGIVSKKILFLWLLIPPVGWILAGMTMSIIMSVFHVEINTDPLGIAVAFSGFLANMVLFFTVAFPVSRSNSAEFREPG